MGEAETHELIVGYKEFFLQSFQLCGVKYGVVKWTCVRLMREQVMIILFSSILACLGKRL